MRRWFQVIGYVLTLRCDEADRIRCAPDPASVTRAQRVGEWLHRLICASCRKAKRQLDALRSTLGDIDNDDAVRGGGLSPAARERLEQALRDN